MYNNRKFRGARYNCQTAPTAGNADDNFSCFAIVLALAVLILVIYTACVPYLPQDFWSKILQAVVQYH